MSAFPDLSGYSIGDDAAYEWYLSDHPWAVAERTRRAGAHHERELEADCKWFPIAAARRPHVKAFIYVVDGVVARVRAVNPTGAWKDDERGYAEAPLGPALGALDAAHQFPTLTQHLGDARPHVRGKIREYLPL